MAPKKATNIPASKRGSRGMNFRPASEGPFRGSTRGKRPLPEPSSVSEVLVTMVVFLCKKALFVDVRYKVFGYLAVVFVGSVVADFLPFPKSYFSRSSNALNQYFVKLGWAWTLATAGSFLLLTSLVYCCGEARRIYRHCLRLAVGTATWYLWTNAFVLIEVSTRKCLGSGQTVQPLGSQAACLGKGMRWNSLDLSGHVFILMYSSLFLVEEARAICGWEGLRDSIRSEDHRRFGGDSDAEEEVTSLSSLSTDQFANLKRLYDAHTPWVKVVFLWLTCLVLLWDVMLLATILYFHTAAEKIPSSLVAIASWFVTYQVWYQTPFSPGLPGEGVFRYMESRQVREMAHTTSKRREGSLTRTRGGVANSSGNAVTFMGMPLRHPFNNMEERDNMSNEERETYNAHIGYATRRLQNSSL